MFGNIYRKYLIRAVRSKDLVIWTFLFPIFLATLFYFSLGNLDDLESFEAVSVAAVEDRSMKSEFYLKTMLEKLSEGEEALLEVQWSADVEEADALLKAGKVEGYITVEEASPRLYIKENGISQTILKSVLDQYMQTKDTVTSIIAENPLAAMKLAGDFWDDSEEFIQELKLSDEKPSQTVSYYYALLALLCMYGGFHGLVVVEGLQANLSPQGARNTLSPGNRYKLFFSSFLGALTIQFFCVVVSICYIQFVLKVSFGSQLGYAMLAGLVGSMAGISLGSVVALPSRWKGGIKSGILVGISLLCSFFAGLMIGGINYLVQEYVPVLALINPAQHIANAFYCLYYYDGHAGYFRNVGILLLMTAVFLGISAWFIKGEQYESI